MLRLAALLPLSALTLLMAQAPVAPSVQEILAKTKAAAGGAAWDRVTHLERRGRLSTGGMKGTIQVWEDVRTGRSLNHFDLGVAKGSQGFDGTANWTQDETGDVRNEEGAADPGTTYYTTRAFWFPERGKAAITYAGLREGHFHVLNIQPKGAQSFELWVDAQTWLIDRIVSTQSGETLSNHFSDYRDIGGLKIPFRERSPKQDPRLDTVIEYESLAVNPDLGADFFRRPTAKLTDFGMDGGRSVTHVPLEFISDHLFVKATINGKGPYRFFLDTGGVNIFTPTIAKELGLASLGAVEGGGVGEKKESFGLTKVKRIQVGDAWLTSQNFYVIPSLESAGKVLGVEIAGVLGYELLRRFVAHVDYDSLRLSLMKPEGWVYRGSGAALPFTFNGHHPRVKGELDGIPGLFDIDTGSGSTLDVYAPFAKEHQLKEKAGKAISTITGSGAGGDVTGSVIRARELKLGSVSLKSPIVALSTTTSGAFADATAAGNVGQGFLQRFDLTFDYAHQVIYFEPNKNHNKPDRWSMAGFRTDQADSARIVEVIAGSEAEKAGLRAGDRLVAINERPIEQWPASERRKLLGHGEPGTRVELRILSGERERTLSLVLKELL